MVAEDHQRTTAHPPPSTIATGEHAPVDPPTKPRVPLGVGSHGECSGGDVAAGGFPVDE